MISLQNALFHLHALEVQESDWLRPISAAPIILNSRAPTWLHTSPSLKRKGQKTQTFYNSCNVDRHDQDTLLLIHLLS